MFREGVYTHAHEEGPGPSVWMGPSSLGSSPDSYEPPSPSACPTQCHAPVRVIGAFLVEAFIMGLHVAQAGIVIGINKGQMNLKAEKTRAYIRGGILGRNRPGWAGQPWRGEGCYSAENHIYAALTRSSHACSSGLEQTAQSEAPWAICLPSLSSRPFTLCHPALPPPLSLYLSHDTESVLHSISFAPLNTG